jgi:hypothetical protein
VNIADVHQAWTGTKRVCQCDVGTVPTIPSSCRAQIVLLIGRGPSESGQPLPSDVGSLTTLVGHPLVITCLTSVMAMRSAIAEGTPPIGVEVPMDFGVRACRAHRYDGVLRDIRGVGYDRAANLHSDLGERHAIEAGEEGPDNVRRFFDSAPNSWFVPGAEGLVHSAAVLTGQVPNLRIHRESSLRELRRGRATPEMPADREEGCCPQGIGHDDSLRSTLLA